MDVVRRLWRSWEPDAIREDTEDGVFADHTKVHPINYDGEFFKVPRAAEHRTAAGGTRAGAGGRLPAGQGLRRGQRRRRGLRWHGERTG